MAERLACLDTSVLIAYLTPEEQHAEATDLVRKLLETDVAILAPSWAWAEVGSVLRRKLRARHLSDSEAESRWRDFLELPIEFIDGEDLRRRSWELARRYRLATLYDAAFLACTEIAAAGAQAVGEFWTADRDLVRQLGAHAPSYMRLLGAAGRR